MWPQGARVIQDTLHGLMQFRRSESLTVDLLSCKELQRLRRIRQLGFASFVFPGVEHSRFAHSLGAAFMAARVGRHLELVASEILPEPLQPDNYSIRDFCVAALCHDLGHGPFSHTWEQVVVGDNWDRAAWSKTLGLSKDDPVCKSGQWHEVVTHALLSWEDGQLHRLLEGNERGSSSRVRDLLSGQYYLQYLSRLLSSDVDVDRCDFLLRDSLLAGLPFGRFQLDRLITCLTFGFDKAGVCQVGLDEVKGLHTAVELLKGRIDLYEILYFHKTVKGMDWLLAKLLTRLKDLAAEGRIEYENIPIIRPVVETLQGQALPPQELLKIDDFAIWFLIGQVPAIAKGDPTAHYLADKLIERDPFRAVAVPSGKLRQFLNAGNEAHLKIQRVVSKYVPGDAKYFYSLDSPKIKVLEEEEAKKAFLIDARNNERRASELDRHRVITETFPKREIEMGDRLLVPREAREDVTKMILGS